MAKKNRPTFQKHEREQKKRERQRKKEEKAAQKRLRRGEPGAGSTGSGVGEHS